METFSHLEILDLFEMVFDPMVHIYNDKNQMKQTNHFFGNLILAYSVMYIVYD